MKRAAFVASVAFVVFGDNFFFLKIDGKRTLFSLFPFSQERLSLAEAFLIVATTAKTGEKTEEI